MHIEIYSDLVCPWCRIGKKQWMDAVDLWDGGPVTFQYRAFLQDPDVPEAGDCFRARLVERKGISDEQLHWKTRQVTEAGMEVGLRFHFERITVIPNTRLAHQLLALAPASHQGALFDGLTAAYFERNVNIGLPDALLAIAAAADVPHAQALVERAVAGDGLLSVKRDLREAQAVGVSGVPFYVINGTYTLCGSRPAASLVRSLDWAARQAPRNKKSLVPERSRCEAFI